MAVNLLFDLVAHGGDVFVQQVVKRLRIVCGMKQVEQSYRTHAKALQRYDRTTHTEADFHTAATDIDQQHLFLADLWYPLIDGAVDQSSLFIAGDDFDINATGIMDAADQHIRVAGIPQGTGSGDTQFLYRVLIQIATEIGKRLFGADDGLFAEYAAGKSILS